MYDDKPLISIIVPAYNVESTIKNTVYYLLNQSYKNIEIICINDGSTDCTKTILETINDNRIRIFNKQNDGVSSARNIGLKRARGKYITFVDPGDKIDRDFIYYLYHLLTSTKSELSICSYDFETIDGTILNRKKSYDIVDEVTFFNQNEAISEIIKPYSKFCGHVWDKMFIRSLIGNEKFDESIHNCEDTLFVYEYLKKCNKIVLGPEIHYAYVQDCNSITNRGYSEKFFSAFNAWEKILQDLCSDKDISILKRKLTRDVVYHEHRAWKTLEHQEKNKYKKRFMKLSGKYKSFDSLITFAKWVYLRILWISV